MPALPPVPNVLKTRLMYEVGTDLVASSRFYLQWGGTAPTPAILDALAQDFYTNWAPAFAGYVTPEVTFTEVTMEDLTSAMGASGLYAHNTPGTRAGGQLPASTVFVFRNSVGRRYRGGKPRVTLPLGAEPDLQTPQAWASAFVALMQGQFAGSMGATIGLTSGGCSITGYVNVSYYEGFTAVENPLTGRYRNVPKLRAGGPVVDPILATTGSPLLGSLRRRVRASSGS